MTMFSHDTIDFLSDLRANNTRDWFEENRKTFHAAVRDPAKAFAVARECCWACGCPAATRPRPPPQAELQLV